MTCGPLNEGQIKRGQERIWAGTDSAVNLPKEIIDTYMEEGGSPHLDAQYTVFAEIVKGMDVVDKIQKVETDPNDRPVEDVRILRTVVVKDYK
jgi:peptidyl-prolyl cis-trans isomerase B (cyclophilin B)